MSQEDQENHGGHNPPPQPRPAPPPLLLENSTATIYFDGLIYVAFNKPRGLFESAILTAAEGHHLIIEVRKRGEEKLIWPLQPSDWNPDHGEIKKRAPFFLYVDSGNGIPEQGSAALNLVDGEQSFKNLLNFESLFERRLPPKPDAFAAINFPHGVAYSALNTDAELKTLPQGESPVVAEFRRNIHVSTLAALDIDAASDRSGDKYLVLAGDGGKSEFFKLKLERGTQYEVQILNQPIPHEPEEEEVHDPREHFLQFYELFELKPGELLFLVDPPIAPEFVSPPPPPPPPEGVDAAAPNPPHSPPCVTTGGNTEEGLGGG